MEGEKKMGYYTDFIGAFRIDRPIAKEIADLIRGLANTRRMKRDNAMLIEAGYGDCGVDGEFFCIDDGRFGEDIFPESVVDENQPPATQPSLWCEWLLAEDNQTIQCGFGDMFESYVEWIQYLIDKILAPNGYYVNGRVAYRGEEFTDFGLIEVNNNKVINHYQWFGDFFG